VAAREKSFAEDRGIDLRLIKQPSWASLRDHLNLGHIDCAHALAPLPLASVLGIGQVHANTCVPFVLGRGGNAITIAKSLADEMRAAAGGERLSGAAERGAALAKVVKSRSKPLTFAMVYPFSSHNYEIRYWLAAAGIHPDQDVRLVAIPPPLMVESLRAGHVDGFCVGEPWNSLAADQALGEIIVSKPEIFPHGIEKVLAVPEAMLSNRPRLTALLKSLYSAAQWCDRPENHEELAVILSRPEYLGIGPELSLQALRGTLPISGTNANPDFLYFARFDANRPRVEEALWLYAQMRRWGQLPADDDAERSVARVFRSDVFDAIFGASDESQPRRIAASDAIDFDGLSVSTYLDRFTLSTSYVSTRFGAQTE
jgi:NitT/TauT family transport system ATP-binding protein